ncbi:MAG: hypothetical protein R3B49_02180 [Phycisphaerales bacterium]
MTEPPTPGPTPDTPSDKPSDAAPDPASDAPSAPPAAAAAGPDATTPSESASAPRSPGFFRKAIIGPAIGLVGIVVGAVIGLAVETGVQSTGVLGPGVDTVIAQQADGFAKLDAKLDALRAAESPEQAKALAGDVQAMVDQQKAYAERTADELRGARAELERLKADALDQAGSAGGADLWLKAGESTTIGHEGFVFSYIKNTYGGRTGDLTVNAGGAKPVRLIVGGEVTFEEPDGVWRVIYKQAEARADGRVGFDVVPPAKRG